MILLLIASGDLELLAVEKTLVVIHSKMMMREAYVAFCLWSLVFSTSKALLKRLTLVQPGHIFPMLDLPEYAPIKSELSEESPQTHHNHHKSSLNLLQPIVVAPQY